MAVLRSDLFNVLREYKQNMTNQLSEVLIRESRALYAEKASRLRIQEEEISKNVESQVVGDQVNILRLMPLSTPDFYAYPT